MARVLVTGISGVGKSAVVGELARRGERAVDADCDEYSHWVAAPADDRTPGTPVEPGRDWVWRLGRVRGLVESCAVGGLFLSGCSPNMGALLPLFDAVVLLSAPPGLIVERLCAREGNRYGRRPEERERVLALRESVEPLLRRAATHEIDTSASLAAVADELQRIARAAR